MRHEEYVAWWKVLILGTVALVLCAGLLLGGCTGFRAYHRAQKRAEANNNVKITHINIRRAQQQAQIVNAEIAATRARAKKRVVEAEGIRRAQDLIAKTLTPLYVQHEAIQAQRAGGGGDRTYIPVGPQGVPLVADLNAPSLENPGR